MTRSGDPSGSRMWPDLAKRISRQARARSALTLRARLRLLVVVVVAGVVGGEAYLGVRLSERVMEQDLAELAFLTTQGMADDLEIRDRTGDREDLQRLLRNLLARTPPLRSITVLTRQGEELTVYASTSSMVGPEVFSAARLAAERSEPVWSVQTGSSRTLAMPTLRDGEPFGAVSVTLSFTAVEQLRTHGRQVTLWFALGAMVVLTLLVDLLARRLVHRPLAGIADSIRKAKAGDLTTRASVERMDEIGVVAQGLNEMLERIENLQATLQVRVDTATHELRVSQSDLIDSYRRVFTLREELARAQQLVALGQMAASVAHQIGTPLNLISVHVQLLIEETRFDTRALDRLRSIEEQIHKVTTAVRSMLDSARRPATAREVIDIANFLRRVSDMVKPVLDAAHVEFQLTVPESPLPVVVDPLQLELVLLNLVSNSLDAMPAGGILTMTVSPHGEGIRLQVIDTGTGIAPNLLPCIFDPWVTTKPMGHGTGLGLSIARDIVMSHGGSIGVRSELGEGTVFTIDLPAAPALVESREP